MDLLKQTRIALTQHLWHNYRQTVPVFQTLETALQQRGEAPIVWDHFAIIDLPSPYSGIPYLSQLFAALGYRVQGLDYLPAKQNDFLWLVETDAMTQLATETLPQIVVADFRLSALPVAIKNIVEKYTAQIPPSPLAIIQCLSGKAYLGDAAAAKQLLAILIKAFSQRPWSLPTLADFKTVHHFNELLAWVLLFGPVANHFTVAAHLLGSFDSMVSFIEFIQTTLGLQLNAEGGLLKGNAALGIEQASTVGMPQQVQLADGYVSLPGPFIEFVWRYPLSMQKKPSYWRDYYSGFVAQNANKVIESLYE
jgi:hypothetical protein